MSKNNQSKYSTSLRKIAFGQTATFDRNDRNEITAEIKRFNSERNPFQFTHSIDKSGVQVTRVVPTNLYDRKLYIENIGKSQLTNALRSNNWSKEAAAREFGISARSIGRMISKHGIASRPYSPAKSSSTKSSSTKTSSKSSTKSKTTNKSR